MTASPALSRFAESCAAESTIAVERTITNDARRLVDDPALFKSKSAAMFPALREAVGHDLTDAEVISACARAISREMLKSPLTRNPSTILAVKAMKRAAEIRSGSKQQ